MMSEILYITVQDSLIFHHITPGPSLSRPAKDASPKARKSEDVVAGFVRIWLKQVKWLMDRKGLVLISPY